MPSQGYSEGARTVALPEQIASTLPRGEAEITEAHGFGQGKAWQIRERELKKVPPDELKPLDELKSALERVLAPLVESDQGELFLVSADERLVVLHLRGRFAGCPGNGLVTEHIILPLIKTMVPQARVEVSSGAILPAGSTRILAPTQGAHAPL